MFFLKDSNFLTQKSNLFAKIHVYIFLMQEKNIELFCNPVFIGR